MKPFNLKDAKAGKPLCTRDGKPVRIICFDRENKDFPLIAAVTNDNYEDFYSYTTDGKFYNDGDISDLDLFMTPEKHKGWINIYKVNGMDCPGNIYDTREKAISNKKEQNYITTIKIEWEE